MECVIAVATSGLTGESSDMKDPLNPMAQAAAYLSAFPEPYPPAQDAFTPYQYGYGAMDPRNFGSESLGVG